MKKYVILLLFICLSASVSGQQPGYFTNPVIRGDMADPSIIRIKNTYYAAGTSSEWAPYYPVYTSKDLVNWQQTGHIFTNKPEWTSNSFWAPELFYHNDKVYCYYTARRKADGISYIGVATADSPLDEFTDHGPVVEHGTEAIDAFIYDDNGQLYISWKAYGLDQRPIELLGSKLSDDGLTLIGEPFSLLKDDEGIGMEGQYHFKHKDYYYIIYSPHSCCGPGSDYDVYVARSKSFEGPYEKYANNPILYGGGGDYISCGHGTAVTTPDGRMFYMCHAYLKGDGFYAGRQPVLHEMFVTEDNWVHFKTGNVAVARQALPFAGSKQKGAGNFEDRFKKSTLNMAWAWNYPYADCKTHIKGGKLYLSGTPKEGNQYGTALCVRPQTPFYLCETQVTSRNESFKGLTMYGDDKNLIAWGVSGDKLILKAVKDQKETVLHESVCNTSNIYLRMKVEKGRFLTFYQSKDGKQWSETTSTPFDGEYLVRWDRIARPGFIHIGDKDTPAGFAYFKLNNEELQP